MGYQDVDVEEDVEEDDLMSAILLRWLHELYFELSKVLCVHMSKCGLGSWRKGEIRDIFQGEERRRERRG